MMRAILLAVVSCLGSSAVVGVARYFTREQAAVTAVRVAVFKHDHADGAPLTADELGEATVPGELASSAWMSPEEAATHIGKPCLSTVAGSALTASHVADLTVSDRTAACVRAISREVDASAAAELEKLLSTFQPRAEPARDVPSGRVLFVTRMLEPGDVLKDSDLYAGDAPREFVTASWVPVERRAELIGQQVLATLQADSPLWWQMLNVPGTSRSCEFEASRVVTAERRRASARLAAAWVEKESASW